ncbi:hypothetical protein LI90_4389 (plasmid) [Carbonactinospora thermoautotrophica]|uniref:Uncharacterized protein n=1 Tax=Carbonactinospora thermoautotrophica TaxID=1469144 RepID=A0A132MHV7_9ACTN|nr:hypothetical protein [Carbonactinospora thermoautotrophica]KWW97417.1 hypothetical protein LI90_4389 [Carbonactinospora thermoautotrophica]
MTSDFDPIDHAETRKRHAWAVTPERLNRRIWEATYLGTSDAMRRLATEVNIYRDVLAAIAEGASNPQQLAAMAWDLPAAMTFHRWPLPTVDVARALEIKKGIIGRAQAEIIPDELRQLGVASDYRLSCPVDGCDWAEVVSGTSGVLAAAHRHALTHGEQPAETDGDR